MSWLDLYFLIRQMTTGWRLGGRSCFAALVSAFLYHERFHSANAVDHLVRIRRFKRRHACRKIEKFLQRKTMNLDAVWQWLWDHYTASLKDCFVLVDWTMWKDGRATPDGGSGPGRALLALLCRRLSGAKTLALAEPG